MKVFYHAHYSLLAYGLINLEVSKYSLFPLMSLNNLSLLSLNQIKIRDLNHVAHLVQQHANYCKGTQILLHL